MEGPSTPAYLSNGGSYGFAEGQLMPIPNQSWSEPIRMKLQTRCAACHGQNLTQLMTLSVVRPRIRLRYANWIPLATAWQTLTSS